MVCMAAPSNINAQSSKTSVASKIEGVYQIPFASEGNKLELGVSNIGTETMELVEVIATLVPPWLKLEKRNITLTGIEANNEGLALFDFSVDREAEVGESRLLSFEIRSGTEVIGRKEFSLAVQPPEEVVLDQNYPNPFSSQTKIGFDVSEKGRVQIAIYDILGREVSRVIDEELTPGH